jgi:antigen 43
MGVIACLVVGSRIRTAHSEIAIEDLCAGDEIVTLRDGVEAVEPVTWIGQRHLDLATQAYPELAAPVRIRAHAIAEGQPRRDLLLSQDHSLYLDGKCVPSRLLVNGGSISIERGTREVTYYHIELAKHGVLFAEGLANESYLDTGNRNWFSNVDEPMVLHPTFTVNKDASAWLSDACAPLAAADEVEPIWSRLALRSTELGYTPTVVRTTEDADMRLLVDGIAIRPTGSAEGDYSFIVPSGARSVRLESRFGIPSDVAAPYLVDDGRRLGLRVSEIKVRSTTDEIVIAVDDPRLVKGWHDVERAGADIWRWTDGSAELPWAGMSGPTMVTLRCKQFSQYPIYDEALRLVA